jgi:hypothetical protein
VDPVSNLERYLTPIASARFHFPFKLDRPAGSGSAIARNATRYAASMIIGFRHKGCDTFTHTGSTRGIQTAHATKLNASWVCSMWRPALKI